MCPLTPAETVLASQCYGYGRWNAPYWFIGPEEGMAPREGNDLTARFNAFSELSNDGLSDCRRFHDKIGENRFHRENPPAALQSTWKFLILALKAFQQAVINDNNRDEIRRSYQRNHWGIATGETCVIELSGLAARSLEVRRQRDLFALKGSNSCTARCSHRVPSS